MTLLKNEITKQERKQGRGAIIDYCQKKRERYNYTFTYEGETGLKYYTVHGVKTTEQECKEAAGN